jgi:hypothetical protein
VIQVTTAFSIDGLRFALLEAGTSGYIELVEIRGVIQASGSAYRFE